MEFTGRVTHIGEKETFGESFTKVTVRLEEVKDQYPQSLSVDFSNKSLELAEKLVVGDIVTVHLNVRSTESKKEAGKFFNNVSAWRCKVEETSTDEVNF